MVERVVHALKTLDTEPQYLEGRKMWPPVTKHVYPSYHLRSKKLIHNKVKKVMHCCNANMSVIMSAFHSPVEGKGNASLPNIVDDASNGVDKIAENECISNPCSSLIHGDMQQEFLIDENCSDYPSKEGDGSLHLSLLFFFFLYILIIITWTITIQSQREHGNT